MNKSERLREILAGISDEELAAIDAKHKDPNYQPPAVKWREDPDPFGTDWDWLYGDTSNHAASAGSGPGSTLTDDKSIPTLPFSGPPQLRFWSRVAFAAAAALVVGVAGTALYYEKMRQSQLIPEGPPLVALLTPEPEKEMGAGAEEIILETGRVFRLKGNLAFFVTIESPVGGFATVIVLTEGRRPEVFPEPGQEKIEVAAGESHTYGPFRPRGRSTFLTVVAPNAGSTAMVRESLEGRKGRDWSLEEVKTFLGEIRDAFWEKGDRVATGSFIIEPPRKGQP